MLTLPERIARRVLNAQGLTSRFIATRAGRLHVLDAAGTGHLPPVVLLHGLSANAICYAGLLKKLAPFTRRIVAPDMPAHGFSEAPAADLDDTVLLGAMTEVLDRVLDETGEPAIVLGNSMGGLAAIRYTLARPGRVAGLVLVSPGGAPMPAPQFDEFLRRFRIDTHADALAFVDSIFARGARGPGILRHAVAHGVRQRFTHPQLRRLLAGVTLEQMLTPQDLAALHVPTLLVWGKQERVLPASHLEFFRRHLPDHAEVEEWPDFGHVGFLEQPTALARRVVEFARIATDPAKIRARRSTASGDRGTLRASA
jgi:pimeloyl-ACP methyl ester carboxylesterase